MSRFFEVTAAAVLALVGLFALVPRANAATGSMTTSQVGEAADAQVQPFHLLVLNEAQSDLLTPSDPNHSAEYDLVLGPSYKFNQDWVVSAKFPFKWELAGYQQVYALDAKIALSHAPVVLDPYQKLIISTAIRAPFSDESRNVDGMYVGGQVGAELDNDLAALGLKYVNLNYTAVLGRNFYQYYTSAGDPNNLSTPGAGQANIVYDFSQRVDLSYSLFDVWTLTGTGKYLAGLDYDNNLVARFELDEELDYQVAKAWSVGIGHSNSADVLQPDGHDSNYALYNPYTSTVFAVLSFTY